MANLLNAATKEDKCTRARPWKYSSHTHRLHFGAHGLACVFTFSVHTLLPPFDHRFDIVFVFLLIYTCLNHRRSTKEPIRYSLFKIILYLHNNIGHYHLDGGNVCFLLVFLLWFDIAPRCTPPAIHLLKGPQTNG